MHNAKFVRSLTLASTFLVCSSLFAQGKVGMFAGSTDIGSVKPGATVYEKSAYRVTGGGQDMWGAHDDFHLTWKKVKGDATLEADIVFPPGGSQPKAKAVLIFRDSLAPESAYADVAIHADGHVTLQYRDAQGAKTVDTTSTFAATPGTPARLRIERRGNTFTVAAGPVGGPMTVSAPVTVPLAGEVYAGMGVCAHDADGVVTAAFSHVELEKGFVAQ